MSTDMIPHRPEPPQKPEFTPKFPYEHLPYTHIHPTKAGGKTHILFRAHDCWCEPTPIFVWGLKERPVAILLIHSDDEVPGYPEYSAVKDEP